MTAPYKKRAKAGWNSDKTLSNKSERRFEEVEIKEQLSNESKIQSASEKKPKSKIEESIKTHLSSMKWAIRSSKGLGLENLLTQSRAQQGGYFAGHYSELYRSAKLAQPILEQALNDPELPSKIKKLIKELLQKA